MRHLLTTSVLLLLLFAGDPSAVAQTMPCALTDEVRLPQPKDRRASVILRHDSSRKIGIFTSELRLNLDGAPNTYHPNGANCSGRNCNSKSRGLDHICNGLSVKDVDGNTVPPSDSQRCLDTYRAARELGFPTCGAGEPCVSNWYGLLTRRVEGRTVPYVWPSTHPYAGFFISTTALGRPDATLPGGRGYVDSREVPYITVSKGGVLSNIWGYGPAMGKGQAELALVIWRQRWSFAVVADIGPANETGEASAALLHHLRGTTPGPWTKPNPISEADPALTILLPRSSDALQSTWPLTDEAIQIAGRAALHSRLAEIGGWGRIAACGHGLPSDLPVDVSEP
jgi:hypothetical protein